MKYSKQFKLSDDVECLIGGGIFGFIFAIVVFFSL